MTIRVLRLTALRSCSYNERLRLSERRHHFNIHELCQVVAKSIGRSVDDIIALQRSLKAVRTVSLRLLSKI